MEREREGHSVTLKNREYQFFIELLWIVLHFFLIKATKLPFSKKGSPRTIFFHKPFKLYDILGRHVFTVFQGYASAGEHTFVLKADNLSSGVYVIWVENGTGFALSRKITLLK